VAKISFASDADKLIFGSTHAANFKMIVTMNKDPAKDTNLYSIDTGIGAHPFRGHYFD